MVTGYTQRANARSAKPTICRCAGEMDRMSLTACKPYDCWTKSAEIPAFVTLGEVG